MFYTKSIQFTSKNPFQNSWQDGEKKIFTLLVQGNAIVVQKMNDVAQCVVY